MNKNDKTLHKGYNFSFAQLEVLCNELSSLLIKECKYEEDVDTYKKVLNFSLELSKIISNKGTYIKFHHDRWITPINYKTKDTFFPFYYYKKSDIYRLFFTVLFKRYEIVYPG